MSIWNGMIRGLLVAAAGLLTLGAASPALAHDEPIRRGDQLIFPSHADIPRFLTETERRFIRDFPLGLERAATAPPVGQVRSVAEYEPMDGVCLSWKGTTAQRNILAQMARWITTLGNANVYLMVAASEQASALSTIQSAGANMSRVMALNIPTDSIWIRDYGPRYVYQGQCRAIVDHTYNRPRPLDDVQPVAFAQYKRHAFYEHQLIHGGGNYHLNALNRGWATTLIQNENPGLTQNQIYNIWLNYQNIQTSFEQPFPTSVDSTQHIDMWMLPLSNNKIIISEWPTQPGTIQANICNAAASAFQNAGWTVYRTPAVRTTTSPVAHYTYTNAVIVNNIVLVPTFTHSTITNNNWNTVARDVFAAAMPNHTIIQVDSQALVTSAGVMHCVMMHVPAHLGGVNPTAYLITYRGGQTLSHGQIANIRWISDDDIAVTSADILLSTNGGQSWTTLATNLPDPWSWNWTVPSNVNTAHGRFRVVVRDAQGNTGFDQSETNIVIGNPPNNPADINGDGVVNVNDLLIVINSWGACPPPPQSCPADIAPPPNGDGVVNVNDLLLVINNWG